jgi:hypothetical protein
MNGSPPANEAGYKETLVYLESIPGPPPLLNLKSLGQDHGLGIPTNWGILWVDFSR